MLIVSGARALQLPLTKPLFSPPHFMIALSMPQVHNEVLQATTNWDEPDP
jgi:hypothetical protein